MSSSVSSLTPSSRVAPRDVAAVAAGAAVEFFDFSVYATFSVMIGHAFFPSESAVASLLLSLSVFGLGFLVRPLGALLIGSYADKAGRKPAMLLTMVLMAIGTGGLVVLPDYATLGIAAPILLVVVRMIQGLAWGGEAGPATTFIMEAAPPHRRGLFTSWQIVAQGAAGISAGAIGYLLSVVLSDEQLASWGWRIPFACGLLILPISIYLRRHLRDTLVPHDESTETSQRALIKEVFSQHSRWIVVGILIISGSTISQYFLNYMATYALHDLHYPTRVAMLAPVLIGIGVMVFSLLGGWMADRYGRVLTIVVPRLLLTLALWPGLVLINRVHSEVLFFCIVALFTALQCISGAGLLVAVCEVFPKQVRSTGFSLVYALGITLFGGSAQLIFSWLSDITGDPVSPAWYLIATNILCMLAALTLGKKEARR
ncbi:MFS transporter [Carnimonas nigrificans]|uniref:MFS transporter n=1 Tax=Carnimonas nigrificans TaxID=64323 RepID=UPI00047285FE|nr:MFS transporter [Carnimonas nigrificans]